MSDFYGYVEGNTVIAEQDIRMFDGCKVRIQVLDKSPTKELDKLFGLWKNHDNSLSVDETIRNMRKGRQF